MVVIPAARMGALPLDRELRPLARNKMTARQLVEFRKTAEAVKQPPWLLNEASDYLLGWCSNNATCSWAGAPDILWPFKPAVLGVLESQPGEHFEGRMSLEVLRQFLPSSPRRVTVSDLAAPMTRLKGKQSAETKPAGHTLC